MKIGAPHKLSIKRSHANPDSEAINIHPGVDFVNEFSKHKFQV
jgi:hypothetical protein